MPVGTSNILPANTLYFDKFIYTLLDSIYYRMTHLENKVLPDTFQIDGLRLAFVSMPEGTINKLYQLNKAVHGISTTHTKTNSFANIKQIQQ